jgi:hypothetical protein
LFPKPLSPFSVLHSPIRATRAKGEPAFPLLLHFFPYPC